MRAPLFIVLLTALASAKFLPVPSIPVKNSSFTNADQVTTTHADIKFYVDFTNKLVNGSVTYTLLALQDGLTQVILDTKYLSIKNVSDVKSWSLGQTHEVIGTPLVIELNSPVAAHQTFTITVEYSTTDKCTALTWMSPSNTFGKKHPFAFTQCEAIHCRTLLPVQDSPQVKFTINYTIIVDEPYTVAAAGIFDSMVDLGNNMRAFKSTLETPIPAYLIAFAAGNIVSEQVGPRTRVYCEPEILEASVYEFAETETYLATAESFLIPYEWKQYNLLILPGSFAYGGMENPTLTFATPTLIAGDRSLTSVVAHEIAHSWTGNLVTNRNWEHFWLNEGFTVYNERKILQKMFGVPTAHLEGMIGRKALQEDVNFYGEDNNFTRLNHDLGDQDPDIAFSTVPYEKGYTLLMVLEQRVGEEKFLVFLRDYITKFRLTTVLSDDFVDMFVRYFPDAQVDWDAWLRGTGMPPEYPVYDESLEREVNAVYEVVRDPEYKFVGNELDGWRVDQIVMLLEKLCADPKPHYYQMGTALNFNTSNNYEIKFRWVRIIIQENFADYFEQVRHFLTSQGRMKYVRPIYRLLIQNNHTELAQEIFDATRDFYQVSVVNLILGDCPELH